MSQIDHKTRRIGRGPGSAALISTAAAGAALSHRAPGHAAITWPQDELLRPAWQALVATVARGVDTIVTWRARTEMRRQLLMLDDRLLSDIGITRAQAQGEAAKPFWRV